MQLDVEAYQLKTIFRLSLPASHPLLQTLEPWALQTGVFELLAQYGLDEYADTIEAFRQGRAIFFRVTDYTAADWIVRERCCLKGSGITILDALSPREAAQHSALRSPAHALPPHLIEQRLVPGRGEGITTGALGGGFWEVLPPSCVFIQPGRYFIEVLSFSAFNSSHST